MYLVKKKENNHIINKRMPFYLTYNTNTINSISIINNNMFTKAEDQSSRYQSKGISSKTSIITKR